MQSGSDLGYRNSPRSLTHARMNTLLTQSSPCEVSQSPGSLTASCVCLELRPLPSPGVTRLQRYYKPLRHPTAPGLSLTGVRLVIPDLAVGLPVLRTLSLCTCCRHYPGAAAGRRLAHLTQPYQPSPITLSGRPAHRPFRDPMRWWWRPTIWQHEVATTQLWRRPCKT